VFLGLTDSHGNQGGAFEFSISDTTNASCVNTQPAPELFVTTNSSNLNTCDPVSISVSGGTPPYNITVVPNFQPLQVISLDSKTTDYVYINRIPANSTALLFYVNDSQGKNATTDRILLRGSNDTTCSGLPNPGAPLTTQPAGHSQTPIGAIIGAVVGGIVLIAVVGYLVWRMRRKRKARVLWDIDDMTPASHTPLGEDGSLQAQPFIMPAAAGASGDNLVVAMSETDSQGVGRPSMRMAGASKSAAASRERLTQPEEPEVIVRHQDAGRAGGRVLDLPPAYGEQVTDAHPSGDRT